MLDSLRQHVAVQTYEALIKYKESGEGAKAPKGITFIQPSPVATPETSSNAPKTHKWTAAQRAVASRRSKERWALKKGLTPNAVTTAAPAPAPPAQKKAAKKRWTPEQRAAQSVMKAAWWAQRNKGKKTTAKKTASKKVAAKAA